MSRHLSALAQEIRNTLFNSSIADIVERLGFQPVPRAAIDDLLRVSADPSLGLESEPPAGFVSSEDYLHKLGRLLRIDGVSISRAINEAKQQRILQSCAFPSWIFVRTQFIQGDAATAKALEHQRRLVLPPRIRLQPHAKQLQLVKSIVRQHAEDNKRSLDFWGDIVEYHFHHADGKHIVITPNGTLSRPTTKQRSMGLDTPRQLALLAA
jgi:hypothetical protein